MPLAAQINSGDTAWILVSTALVLFMTLPGLALFYGGLVRGRNVLSVMAQCAGLACMASVLWAVCLYSLAFKGDGSFIGNLDAAFLKGITTDSVAPGTAIPETVFIMFQMTFAIITPALYIGALVERMKFSALMLFSALWLLLVYVPVCHWVWGGGWLAAMGVLDLAGGIVVHATAGVSAIVLAIILKKRNDFPGHAHPPHNPGMVFIGAAMLWVGWFGFNAGSQLSAGGGAGMTMLVTHLSACSAGLVWSLIERVRNGKVGLVGMVTGLIAGLAAITPASGVVGPMGAIFIGALSAVLCFFAVNLIREKLHIDDSLDVFAVHGVGGILGTLLLSVFGQTSMGGLGLVKPVMEQLGIQSLAVGVTIVWSIIATVVIAFVVKLVTGLRVTPEQEQEGLDYAEHGETAYPE
ncbi:MAG: ammonium transporter [Verrucomicrobia bacterium]|jgi:Amt family ammonium transporter|nr:ammonium transporter [Verrucomicrobiota bacterium]|tara:strand:+ start:18785 stop:20011 length:1227 start_codon:yes stop_codon:yes gene_type:complete